MFLVAFLGGCLWLDATNRVVFTSPWAFALTLAAPWVWWLHMAGYSGLRGVRALVALAVRFVVLGVFIMALADPRAVRTSNVLSVLYALDVSDSMGDTASKKAMEFILRTAGEEKPEKDEAGLLVFARQAMVELPPRVTFPFEAINSRVARDGTNIEKALSLASAMLPDTKQGRIVLVTDGAATEGDLTRVLDDLAARQVPVDVLPVEYDHDREVWLEKLEVPRTVRLGETYEAAVILSSLKAGSGTLVLTENGQKIAEEKVSFEAGKNRYALKLSLREPGLYEYVATIEVPPGEDGWQKNNLAVNHIYLKGKGKVLIVAAPDEQRDVVPMVRALRRGQREVEVISGEAFPRDVLALLPYDGIVFVNVPADAFDVVQLKALHDAVYHQGTGFLMVGGKDSFGPGGYHRTPVEEALPVTMEPSQKKVLPKGALVIILHTCEFPEGNTWAKRITKEAIRVLSAKDDVGVLLYGMGEQWLFQLTPAGEYERLVLLINKAEPGDMPTFQGTMKMGFDGLKANDASQKHMIIISDGDPSPPTPALLADFQKSQISVSTIAVFPHEGLASTDLLRRIATATGGRFYHPQDPNLLPSIFIKEAKTLKRSMIDNKTFVPLVDFPSPILKGISSFPPLRGLVLTSAKPRANLVLRVPEEEDIDPVLAVWRYGVGKTAAFTSDLTTNWGADWVNAPLYEPFVNQLLTDIVRPAQQGRLRLHTYAEGSTGVIVVEDFHPEASFLEVAAQVGGPQDKSATVPLRQVGPRRYQGDFPLWGNGQYHIMVSGVGTGRNERELGRFVVPYSPEYLRFRSNPIAIEQIVKRTGGRLLTSAEKGKDIFLKQKKPRASSESVVDWFLLALACLIPLDVAVRRVQLDWLVIRSWLGLGRRRAASGATMGALLKRKEAIKFPVHERERPLVPPPVPSERRAAQPPPAVAPKPRPAPKPEPPKPAGPPPTSTTGRLLEAKKKWKKE